MQLRGGGGGGIGRREEPGLEAGGLEAPHEYGAVVGAGGEEVGRAEGHAQDVLLGRWGG